MQYAEDTDFDSGDEFYFGTPLRIHFTEAGFPCEVLVRVAVAVESAILEIEREELDTLRKYLDGSLPMIDASLYRLEKYAGSAAVITGASDGSVVLLGIIAGLSYWILDKTFGETLKESWKGCATHKRLQEIFVRRRGERLQRVADRVETKSDLRTGNWPVRLHANFSDGMLDIEVHLIRSDVPPARLPGDYRGRA